MASGIPFFDHASLLALRTEALDHTRSLSAQSSAFPLRLLIAAKCINCTPASLRFAFEQFPGLVFLDLSRTVAARDDNVLAVIGCLPDLQILKLRGVGLQDHNFRVLADSLSPKQNGQPATRHAYRLRSLDVRDNLLTEESVKIIITRLIRHDHVPSIDEQRWGLRDQGEYRSLRSSSAALQTMQLLKEFDLDTYFIRNLSNTNADQNVLQDLDRVGVTHLYLSNNRVSAKGLISLTKTKNLHILDIGSFEYGINRLTWPFEDHGSSLTYLRVSHLLVTAPVRVIAQEITDQDKQESQLPDLHEAHGASSSEMVSGAHSGFATDMYEDLPPYEEQAESSFQAGVSIKSELDPESQKEDNRMPDQSLSPPHAEASNLAAQKSSLQSPYSRSSLASNDLLSSHVNIVDYETHSEIQRIISKRRNLRCISRLDQRALPSGRMSTIETLVLTDIPAFTRSAQLIQNLQDFITDCAMEHHLAIEQARLEQTSCRTMGISQREDLGRRSRELFALRKIVLELIPQRSEEPSETEVFPSPSPTISSRLSKSKTWSSVDDRDVDTFWKAAKNDFSFFDEEQVGHLEAEVSAQHRQSSPLAITTSSTGISGLGDEPDTAQSEGINTIAQPLLGVVVEIARWRTDKRKQSQAAEGNTFVPGAWPGKVEIVRPNGQNFQENTYDYSKSFSMSGVFQ